MRSKLPLGLTLALGAVFLGFQNCGSDSSVKRQVSEQAEVITTTNLRIDDLNSIMLGMIEYERQERIKADEELSTQIQDLKKRIDVQESKLASTISTTDAQLRDLTSRDQQLANQISGLESNARSLEQNLTTKLLATELSLNETIRQRGNELWVKLLNVDSDLADLRQRTDGNAQQILNDRAQLLEAIQSQRLFEIYANDTFASKRDLIAQQQLYTALESATKALDLRLTKTAQEVSETLGARLLELSSKISALEVKVSAQQKDVEALRSDLASAVEDYRRQHLELVDLLRGEIARLESHLGTLMVFQNNALRSELIAELSKKALELTLYTNKAVSLISDGLSALDAKLVASGQQQSQIVADLRAQMTQAISNEQEQRRRISADLALLTERVFRLETEMSDQKAMTDLNTKMIAKLTTDFEAEKASVASRFAVQKQQVDARFSQLEQDMNSRLTEVAGLAESLVKNLGNEVQQNFKTVTLEIATLKVRQANSENQLKSFVEEYQKDRSRTVSFATQIAVPFRHAQEQLATVIDQLSSLQLRFVQILNPDEDAPDFYNEDLRKLLARLGKRCGSLEDTSFANVFGMDSFQVLSIEYTRLLLAGLRSGDGERDLMFHSFGAIAGNDRLHQAVVGALVRAPFGDADADCKYEIQQWARGLILGDKRFEAISRNLSEDDEFERRLEVLFDTYQTLAAPLKDIQTQIELTTSGLRDSEDAFRALIAQTSLDLVNAAWDQRGLADRLALLEGFEKVQTTQGQLKEEMEAGFSELRARLKGFEEQTNARLNRIEQQQGNLTLSLKRALDVLISLSDRAGYADLRAYALWAGQPINYTPVIYPNWQPKVTMVQHFFAGPLSLRNKTDACTGAKILPKGGIQGYYQFGGWGPCWVNFRGVPLPHWGNEFKTLWMRVFGAGHIVNLRVNPAVQKENPNAFRNYNYDRNFDFRNDLQDPNICLTGTFDNGVFDIRTPDLLDFYLKNIRTWGGVTVSVSTQRHEQIGTQEIKTTSPVFNYTIQVFSPLIVDLKSVGLPRTISSMNSQVLSDLTNSGDVAKTGWVHGTEAAFLLRDDFQVGTRVQKRHLFAEKQSCRGVIAETGFDALACFDRDGDGAVTMKDPMFKKLRLFFDLNANGRIDQGEVRALNEFGLKKLNLRYELIPEAIGVRNGNDLRYIAPIEGVDGKSKAKLIDVYFGTERD